MENNDKLIESLRNCGFYEECDVCHVEVDHLCKRKLMRDAADALANAQTTIASDQRIIQSLRQSCDAFSRRNMDLVATIKDLKAKERHGRWIHLGGVEYGCTRCKFVTSTEGSWEKPWERFCPSCGARMDEEDET